MKQVVGGLVVETIARIRRERFIKGKTIEEIARDQRVSRTQGGPHSSTSGCASATKAGAMGI
jgi:hypothetical protein